MFCRHSQGVSAFLAFGVWRFFDLDGILKAFGVWRFLRVKTPTLEQIGFTEREFSKIY
jgi:hypothetical protein